MKNEKQREEEIRSLFHEASNKFTDAVLGIGELFGLDFEHVNSEVKKYQGHISYKIKWERTDVKKDS